MKILCVEDGSVDIEAIENGELAMSKVLVFKQGATPPYVIEVDDKLGTVVLTSERYYELEKMADNYVSQNKAI